jgi:hypothetical protein
MKELSNKVGQIVAGKVTRWFIYAAKLNPIDKRFIDVYMVPYDDYASGFTVSPGTSGAGRFL